jgi:hypothetical protein
MVVLHPARRLFKMLNVLLVGLAGIALVSATSAVVGLTRPSPVIWEAIERQATIHVEVDKSPLGFLSSECVHASWRIENIRAVFVGEKRVEGVEERLICDAQDKVLTVVFVDGTRQTYPLVEHVGDDVLRALLVVMTCGGGVLLLRREGVQDWLYDGCGRTDLRCGIQRHMLALSCYHMLSCARSSRGVSCCLRCPLHYESAYQIINNGLPAFSDDTFGRVYGARCFWQFVFNSPILSGSALP